ncbi:hypothetical protein L1887_35515 [Cichorium endivia]|nr:hypothetical protein L1887_35515 [Cichorium endivia]
MATYPLLQYSRQKQQGCCALFFLEHIIYHFTSLVHIFQVLSKLKKWEVFGISLHTNQLSDPSPATAAIATNDCRGSTAQQRRQQQVSLLPLHLSDLLLLLLRTAFK